MIQVFNAWLRRLPSLPARPVDPLTQSTLSPPYSTHALSSHLKESAAVSGIKSKDTTVISLRETIHSSSLSGNVSITGFTMLQHLHIWNLSWKSVKTISATKLERKHTILFYLIRSDKRLRLSFCSTGLHTVYMFLEIQFFFCFFY